MVYDVFFQISQLRILDTTIQALLTCIMKVVLHIKWATKTVYGNGGFCKLKTQFFSSLNTNLMINVIFPIFLVHSLHLNTLSQIPSEYPLIIM